MFYDNSRNSYDENVITIDGSSIESDLYSNVLSPVVDENTILNLLQDEKKEIVPKNLERSLIRAVSIRKRDKLGNFFKTLYWRSKQKQIPDSVKDKDIILETDDNSIRNIPSSITPAVSTKVDTHNNQISENSPYKEFTEQTYGINHGIRNLYDNSQPMLYKSEEELIKKELIPEKNKSIDYCSDDDKQATNLISKKSSKEIAEQSTLRSLGRTMSLFSLRSKNRSCSPKKSDKINKESYLQNASNLFELEITLLEWKLPKSKLPNLVNDRVPKSKQKIQNDTIYLLQNNTTSIIDNSKTNKEEKHVHNKNIQNLINYPVPELNAIQICNNNLRSNLEKSDFTPDYSNFLEKRKEKAIPNIPDSMYSIRSLNLQNIDHICSNTSGKKNCLEKVSNDLSWLNHFNGSYNLQKIQTCKSCCTLLEPWNIWLAQTVDNSYEKKINYKVLFKVEDGKTLEDLCKNSNLMARVTQKQQLFILKKNEIPIFHGRRVTKRLGEYVYVIPGMKELLVWKSVIYLLLSGKFDLNTVGYNIRGICWREFNHKNKSGFYLTFYVNDRDNFDKYKMSLFLSDLRVLIPELQKQYFKKCKTIFPNEKKINVVEVV